MFFFGFLVGAACATWFILEDNGRRLIRLGERVSSAARVFHEWRESS